MVPFTFCYFWAYLKFYKEEHASFLDPRAVHQSDLQDVTKFKPIGPCVQELEPKMRVNLGFLVVTFV